VVAVAGSRVTGGAGDYNLSGNEYIEYIQIAEPKWIVGLSNRATCVVEGDRWFHSFRPAKWSRRVPAK
jgi:hypothetical protein